MEYLGEYKDGKKHGKGRYTWSDGGIYVGNWKDGKEHGQGTYTYPDGRKNWVSLEKVKNGMS